MANDVRWKTQKVKKAIHFHYSDENHTLKEFEFKEKYLNIRHSKMNVIRRRRMLVVRRK